MTTGKLGVKAIDGAAALGETCNNPLNLMGASIKWRGMKGTYKNSAGDYVVFQETDGIDGWVFGYRAAFIDWKTKSKRAKGRLSLRALIYSWAPPNVHNNKTAEYLADVSASCGLSADSFIDVTNRDQCVAIARAMTRHEQGRCLYDNEDIGWGWDLAHGVTPVKQGVNTPAVVSTAAAGAVTVGGGLVDALKDAAPSLQAAGGISGWIGTALGIIALATLAYALYRLYKDKQTV